MASAVRRPLGRFVHVAIKVRHEFALRPRKNVVRPTHSHGNDSRTASERAGRAKLKDENLSVYAG